MEGHSTTSILLLIIAVNSFTSAVETRKVLHIPEKIIGGVIDIVQNHKNKPTQQVTAVQGQAQQQLYQGYPQQYAPWNTGYQPQNQGQAQYQGQYGNYGYTQPANNYPQGNYVNSQNYPSGQYGGTQSQAQGQYQYYPQSGNQYQVQNQQSSGQASQFQNQFQGQGQQSQVHLQNQQFQNQNQQSGQFVNQNLQAGQFVNQNQNGNLNFQGSQQVVNQQNFQNQQSGGFVGQAPPAGTFGGNQQSGNFVSNQQHFVGPSQPTNNFVGQNQPQGQFTQTSFGGQNHQSSQFQGQPGNQSVGPTGSNSGGFQISSGHQPGTGTPGPTCVCQAWAKPQNGILNDMPSQRNEENAEKTE